MFAAINWLTHVTSEMNLKKNPEMAIGQLSALKASFKEIN